MRYHVYAVHSWESMFQFDGRAENTGHCQQLIFRGEDFVSSLGPFVSMVDRTERAVERNEVLTLAPF